MRFFRGRLESDDGQASLLRNTGANADAVAVDLVSDSQSSVESRATGASMESGRAPGALHALPVVSAAQLGSPPDALVVDVEPPLQSTVASSHANADARDLPATCSPRSPSCGTDCSDSQPTCLICLEHMDPSDDHSVVSLGCQCKGAAAYRHRDCLDQWLRVKGDTECDVCKSRMTAVTMPPPPPVPGYVVFPDLDHSFEVQLEVARRYLWHNAVTVLVYCIVLALLMDIPLHLALLLAAGVILLIVLRYLLSVAVNTIARRTVLSFQTPESS